VYSVILQTTKKRQSVCLTIRQHLCIYPTMPNNKLMKPKCVKRTLFFVFAGTSFIVVLIGHLVSLNSAAGQTILESYWCLLIRTLSFPSIRYMEQAHPCKIGLGWKTSALFKFLKDATILRMCCYGLTFFIPSLSLASSRRAVIFQASLGGSVKGRLVFEKAIPELHFVSLTYCLILQCLQCTI